MNNVLFITSEAYPLIKTGGLGDVSGSLPKALENLSQDVRIVLPNYQALKTDLDIQHLCSIRIDQRKVDILETRLPESDVKIWLVDYPPYFAQPGNPYHDISGNPWPDSAERFALFCKVCTEIAMNRAGLDWKPNILHCNDWQTGLVPALLKHEESRPFTVFTIHNLAYQGLFPRSTFVKLNLPGHLWHPACLEFYGMMSFIKGGLTCADRITTVSPTYAMEIQTPEFGYGLEGLLKHRQDNLSGIINGIDLDQWNPETDPHIEQHYSAATLPKKKLNKSVLQQQVSLEVVDTPVIGLISRLVEQKGIDLVIDILPELAAMPLQFVLLGSGNKAFEKRLLNLARLYPETISINLGYDEKLAHLIEAGADIFLMPSRFEPCGLNQMYSLRYGTIPIVRKTGGLADTVKDALPSSLSDKTATGVVFEDASSGTLLEAVKRALLLYNDPKSWRTMQKQAMAQDFSWLLSAQKYLKLYESINLP